MLTHTAAIQLRETDRARISAAVDAHLATGGTIERLSHCERAPMRPISYNNRTDVKGKGRREFAALELRISEHAKGLAAIGLTAEQAGRQMRKSWEGKVVISAPRLEQIAAKYGYSFHSTERGRT